MINKADVEIYKKFQKSPIFFIEKMFGLVPQTIKPEFKDRAKYANDDDFKAEWFEKFEKNKHITWQQWLILRAVERGINGAGLKRISVKSGHGIGKSAVISMLILWYLFCFKNSQIGCTAPTSEQLHDILWKELMLWLGRMPERIANLYEWQSGYLRIKESPETWYARARTARKENPEAMAGLHGEFVMIIADEASGVANEIFTKAEGALTSDNIFVLLISNPTRLIGYFYDTFHADKLNWVKLSFSTVDSPVVTADYAERIGTKYGFDSDEYRYMVLGDFPKEEGIDSKGYLQLLVRADLRQIADSGFVGKVIMGIDPSGEGEDETAWTIRDEFRAKIVGIEKTSTPKSIAQKTITLMDQYKIKPEDVFIDGFGEGAKSAVEITQALGKAINVVMLGERPVSDENLYLNKRAWAFNKVKEWCRNGGELITDKHWEELLVVKYTRALSGKKQIMSKEMMRKEGIDSPNCADALMLTFFATKLNEKKVFKQPRHVAMSEFEGGDTAFGGLEKISEFEG